MFADPDATTINIPMSYFRALATVCFHGVIAGKIPFRFGSKSTGAFLAKPRHSALALLRRAAYSNLSN
jgi:hypothetical protein